MSRSNNQDYSSASHNQAGCPYLNQSGFDAVQRWAQVLEQIDPQILPVELQQELRLLRSAIACEEYSSERIGIR
jgi:hypothetical protein